MNTPGEQSYFYRIKAHSGNIVATMNGTRKNEDAVQTCGNAHTCDMRIHRPQQMFLNTCEFALDQYIELILVC